MKKQIRLLCAEADREALRPVLDALRARGLRVTDTAGGLRKNDIILAALSEGFYADSASVERLLSCLAAGAETVLPLQLDGAAMPDTLKNVLYSRNIIPAAGRDAAHTAERICAALPQKKSRLPLLLTAGALVLVAVVGLLIWRGVQNRKAVSAMSDDVITVPVSLGLTEEDLADIADVVIVGDQVAFFTDEEQRELGYWPGEEYFSYLFENVPDGEDVHWYSNETGQELSMVHYDDLRFLSLMPRLRYLTLVLVETEADRLPDLSEASLLERVSVLSCGIDSLAWLSSATLDQLMLRFTPVTDFYALTSCKRLRTLSTDMFGTDVEADFSGFAPPQLDSLWLWHANRNGSIDLSGLNDCPELTYVTLGDIPLEDLSCLQNAGKLKMLWLNEMKQLRDLTGLRDQPLEYLEITGASVLRDISAAGALKKLNTFQVESCERLSDLSPLAGCEALECFHVWGMHQIRDLSFLASLKRIDLLELFDVDIPDLDFLEAFAGSKHFNLAFSSDIRDYSGLAYIKDYDNLHLNVRSRYNQNADISVVLPYLEGATVENLHLHECNNVDLSQLPTVTENLEIWYGDLRDLSTLPDWPLKRVQLYDAQYLTSLDGIQNLPAFRKDGTLILEVTGCPRLRDWSAIEEASLAHLTLEGVYTLPVFDEIGFGSLRMESIENIRDLSMLANLSDGHSYNSIELVGLDELSDLSPLRRLRIGHMEVPPQVAEQAQELVEEGVLDFFEVAYPDGSWQPFDGAVELLSLDELETLPKSLLRRVERVCIVGDRLMGPEENDIWWEWEDGKDTPIYMLHNGQTDELTPIEYGEGVVKDLSLLSELTGLRELRLYDQPMESLDGIQNLQSLTDLQVCYCIQLTDVSAAFTLQGLRSMSLDGCPVNSIQGIQNLQGLCGLNLYYTQVTDLTPLAQLDYRFAVQDNNGFELILNGAPVEDYAPLASIPVLNNLDVFNVDALRFIPYLEEVELYRLSACGAFQRDGEGESEADSNALFAEFIRSHLQLRELWIPWNDGITDLTPLLELEQLEFVRVSYDMEEAIASLDGLNYSFNFEIEGG